MLTTNECNAVLRVTGDLFTILFGNNNGEQIKGECELTTANGIDCTYQAVQQSHFSSVQEG